MKAKKYIPFILAGLLIGRMLGWIITLIAVNYIGSQAVFKIVLSIGEIMLPLIGAGMGVWLLKRIERWAESRKESARPKWVKFLLVSLVIIVCALFIGYAWYISSRLDEIGAFIFLPLMFLFPFLIISIIGTVASVMRITKENESDAVIPKNDQIDPKQINDRKWAKRFVVGIFAPIVILAVIVFAEIFSGTIPESTDTIALGLMMISGISLIGMIVVGIKTGVRKIRRQP